jgi:hypothetical protein
MENIQIPSVETSAVPITTAPPKNNLFKTTLLSLVGLLILSIVGIEAFMVGKNSSQPVGTPAPITQASPSPTPGDEGYACTADAKLCPDGSYVGRTGPKCEFTACPSTQTQKETWKRKQYISNGQVVWDILQPSQTTTNEAGLHEGYLAITSQENKNTFMAEFYYPKLDTGDSSTFDKWVESYIQANLGDTFIDRSFIDIIHPQGVEMKILKTTSISPGGTKNTPMPMYFVFIWSHKNEKGELVNPSLITIKPVSNPTMENSILEAFTKKLSQGIHF